MTRKLTHKEADKRIKEGTCYVSFTTLRRKGEIYNVWMTNKKNGKLFVSYRLKNLIFSRYDDYEINAEGFEDVKKFIDENEMIKEISNT